METLQRAAHVAELSGAPKKHELGEPATSSTECNYVDLGNAVERTKSVKVTFTGEGNQLAVFKWRGESERRAHPFKDSELETDTDFTDSTGTDSDVTSCKTETEERDDTDMYLNSRCESYDGGTERQTESEPESHYITTHEIQLTELDHDVDRDLGRSLCWDYDDDHLVYSFVDYASFESGGGATDERDRRKAKNSHAPRLADTGAVASTESEFCESEKSSPGKAPDDEDTGNSPGRIRLSIKACSRAVCENGSGRHRDLLEISGDKCDSRAFIPAPGRVHLASKRKGRDVNECSSCASSSVSEPDDADKEVRNLTAKTFRSLACSYFDAINLRTSSESSVSVSEYGLGGTRTWSALVHGNFNGKTLENGKTVPVNKTIEPVVKDEPVCIDAVTADLSSEDSAARVPDAAGCSGYTSATQPEMERESDEGTGDGCKKAVFASSLLQNVISKRMRSENERNLETSSACSPRDGDRASPNARALQRQTSETTGSGTSVISAAEEGENEGEKEGGDAEEDAAVPGTETEACTNEKIPVARSLNSFFLNVKEDEEIPTGKAGGASDKTTKMSHLYVPSRREPEWFPPRVPGTASSRGRPDTPTNRASELEIRVRSVKEPVKRQPFSIAHLLTPNVACSSAKPAAPAPLLHHHALSGTDRVPHFMVRNVRENKCKLQTPIHHVRDVRKLVKSSYRFVSVEPGASAKKEPDKTGFSGPMVIKCQSVNTKAHRYEKPGEPAREIAMPKRGAGNEKTESKPVKARTDSGDRKPDGAYANRAALEKLKAAVKTMEELYVFDRNEWRRKTEAPPPRPVADSHVLSLIKTGAEEEEELSKVKETTHVKAFPHAQAFETAPKTFWAESSRTQQASDSGNSRTGKKLPDPENYFTIPVCTESTKPVTAPAPAPCIPAPACPPLQCSPVVTACWSPVSPSSPPYLPTLPSHVAPVATPLLCPPHATQRKLLLDPFTGLCYLVDAPFPLLPAAQRLYCPDTGCYVDVPLSGAPLPLPVSPVSPMAAYLLYPAAPLPPGEGGVTGAATTESSSVPYFGAASQQQGPRIVAPPSFDGTTMSFVLEHR